MARSLAIPRAVRPAPTLAVLICTVSAVATVATTTAAQVASETLRPPAMGKEGMIATAHPLATLAGQKMLVEGGNAIDAIVAAAAALNAVEPYMSGTAGVGYMLLYSAEERRVRSLVFGGWTPASFDAEAFLQQQRVADGAGHGTAEPIGPKTAAVPGNLAGWNRALEDYGTFPLERVLAPAIQLLEEGVPITEFDQAMWRGNRNRVRQFPTSAAVYLKEGEHPYEIGDVFRNSRLAATMRKIAAGGVGVFYEGEVAREIAAAFARDGGFITLEDLAAVPDRVQWTEPISIDYRGHTIYNHPPPGMGLQQLQTLAIMEGFDLAAMGHNTAEYLAHLFEAVYLSREDTDRYIGDPGFVEVPVAPLLAPAYIAGQRARVAERVRERQQLVDRAAAGEESGPLDEPRLPALLDDAYLYATTSLSAVDRWGNAVVITQTLGGGFGSGYVAGETGLAFNNAMEWMVMEPGQANSAEPGKAVGWCIGAMIQVHRDGVPHLIVGSPGSFGILQSVPQIVMNALDFRMPIQEAIDAPRFRWKDELRGFPASEIIIETRVDPGVRAELEGMGYRLDTSGGEWTMAVGGAQAIVIDRVSGWLLGGADPRRNGYATGW
jgi:gamma-glutamyltranspeptidase / glutathione hydrolase